MAKKEALSEIQVTLNVIGGKWKPLILHYLEKTGTKHYSEILRYLGSAPKKTLTTQLRELEADGIISRKVIPTVPVQVEYSVTKHGETLYPLLDVMCAWGYVNAENYDVKHPTCAVDEAEREKKMQRLAKLHQWFNDEHLGDWENQKTHERVL